MDSALKIRDTPAYLWFLDFASYRSIFLIIFTKHVRVGLRTQHQSANFVEINEGETLSCKISMHVDGVSENDEKVAEGIVDCRR
jgi:hypothetical protein